MLDLNLVFQISIAYGKATFISDKNFWNFIKFVKK